MSSSQRSSAKADSRASISRFFQARKRPRTDTSSNSPNDVIVIDDDKDSPSKEEHEETDDKTDNISLIPVDDPEGKRSDQEVNTGEVEEQKPPAEAAANTEDASQPSNPQKHVLGCGNVAKAKNSVNESLQLDENTAHNSEQIATPEQKEKDGNPFAKFAFQGSASPKKQATLANWITSPPKKATTSKPQTFEAGGKEWISIKDLPKGEQERIVTKWHSLVDPEASLDDRRFQVLVAARLHARCQEPAVRKAMNALREAFGNELSVANMAKANADDFLYSISNLQYYPTKGRHLVKAANEIKNQFGGQVPEDEDQLKQLTGIGPVIADLLSFVNTRGKHQERETAR